MMQSGNGNNFNQMLISQLDNRLARIEIAIDRLADELDGKHEKLNGRLRILEDQSSKARGGWTVLTVVGSVAGALGGFATKYFG